MATTATRASTFFDAVVEFGDQQVLALLGLLAPRDIAGQALKAHTRPVVSNSAFDVSSSHTSRPSGRMKRKVTE